MNTEQQLRERAEAILDKHSVTSSGGYQTNPEKYKILNAMIDFHKQEVKGLENELKLKDAEIERLVNFYRNYIKTSV